MADPPEQVECSAVRGQLLYTSSSADQSPPSTLSLQHSQRQSRITIAQFLSGFPDQELRRQSTPRQNKLAISRDSAFRFFRSVIPGNSKQDNSQSLYARRASTASDRGEEMPATDFLRSRASSLTHGSLSPSTSHATIPQRPALSNGLPQNSQPRTTRAGSVVVPEEKPLVAGGGVSLSVHTAEPVLFLQGYDQNDNSTARTTMLRGNLHLKVTKNAKIKSITLKFKGTATTKWPEGIPPKKIDFEEADTLMSHTWPFFNAQFANAETSHGADHVRLVGNSSGSQSPYEGSPASSQVNLNSKDQRRLSLQQNHVKSFDRADTMKTGPSVAQKGYRTFYPGDYLYNFELPIDSRLPESIDVDLGSVKYELEATVERAGAFRGNLVGMKPIVMIRAPAEGSLEQTEPIAISRNWEDQLHYDIVISGKSFPLGSKVPIAFKLTPLAKVQLHRVKVFVTENTEYFCSNKRVHRMEPTRKVLLFEKRADGPSISTFPGSTMRITAGGGVPYEQREAAARGEEVVSQDSSNLLGRLAGEANVGPTEMEFSVQLPGCHHSTEKDRVNRLHFDTTYQNIQVHHWIKIVMRLSKPDKDDPTKRRHFEISIDSPFHILSCRASQANISLPAYTSPEAADDMSELAECGCPGAPRHRVVPGHVPSLTSLQAGRNDSPNGESLMPSLARPQQAHLGGHDQLQRPIHMLRAPSFNPPAFDDEEPPPPLVTPPPQYNDIASPSSGLADYFSRLADAYDDDESEDETHSRGSRRGRVNIPLTPGSRVNRSMDLQRGYIGYAR